MKSVLSFSLVITLITLVFACGGEQSSATSNDNNAKTETKEETALTFRSVMADIDAYEGKDVTLDLELIQSMKINGIEVARLGDGEKLGTDAPFTILLGDDTDPFRALKKGDKVKVKGTVAFGDYGFVLLEQPKIL